MSGVCNGISAIMSSRNYKQNKEIQKYKGVMVFLSWCFLGITNKTRNTEISGCNGIFSMISSQNCKKIRRYINIGVCNGISAMMYSQNYKQNKLIK